MIPLQWGDLPCGITRSQKLQGALRFLRKFSQVWCTEGKMPSVFPMRKKACCRSGTRTDLRTWIRICRSPAWWAPSFERPKEQGNECVSGPHSLLGTNWFPPSLMMLQPISEALSLTSLGTSIQLRNQPAGWPRTESPQKCAELHWPQRSPSFNCFYVLLTVKHRPR